MNMIFKSFRQAFEAILRLRMFLLVLAPPMITVMGLFLLFALFWQNWVLSISSYFSSFTIFQWFIGLTGLPDFSQWMAVIFLILVFIPLAYLVAVLLTTLFVVPVILRWVVAEDFKHLEKKRGGSVLGSLWNAGVATVLFVVAFFVTLPLWLLPGFQILGPLFLTAWLNKRVFLYDVLQDYASLEERRRIEKEESGPLFGMGLILGFLSYIPLAFFVVPVLSALCYTYYGLNALVDRRSGKF